MNNGGQAPASSRKRNPQRSKPPARSLQSRADADRELDRQYHAHLRRAAADEAAYYHNDASNCFGWTMALVLVGLAIAIIVVIAVQPYTYPYYPSARAASDDTVRDADHECTPNEVWDKDLVLCAPRTITPVPILAGLMDPALADQTCTSSFFQQQCGTWIANHTNENRAFTYVFRKNQHHAADIVRDPGSGPVYNFYRSCLDTLVLGSHTSESAIETRHLIRQVTGDFRTHADLPVLFARLARYGFTSPFSVSVEPHPTRPRVVALLRYDGFPPALLDDPDVLTSFLSSGEAADASPVRLAMRAERVINVLRQLSAWHAEREDASPLYGSYEEYIKSATYTRHDMTTIGELIDMSSADFWHIYLREINGVGGTFEHDNVDVAADPLWILDKDYFRHLFRGMTEITVSAWKAYAEFSVIYNTHNFFPELPHDSYFRSHDAAPVGKNARLEHRLPRVDAGARAPKITEQRCVQLTQRLLPGMIAAEFLHRHMPDHEAVRARVTRVVKNVRSAFVDVLRDTLWMSAETRAASIEKIQNIVVRAVHPSVWETEPFASRLTRDRYLRNLSMIRRYRAQRNIQLWTLAGGTGSHLDRDAIQRFAAPLTTVNAYYAPRTNTITIFAGLISEPFYSAQFSEMSLYATLGMIAGHEMSHALDSSGRLFDKFGSMVEWWDTADVAEFQHRAQCIVNEYGAPHGCDNANYGTQTLGEDMADITGITLAWRAYFEHTAQGRKNTRDDRQYFFKVFAQLWCESYDQEHLCDRVNNDVHSVAWFRVDKTLRQLSQFKDTFGCHASDTMVNENACLMFGSA